MPERYVRGTPPMIFLPAKSYIFRVEDEHYMIRIPRKGKYSDLAPEIFDDADGEFSIYDEESKIFFTPSITKVLFATSQYPKLEFNQFFSPYSIKFEEEEVVIIGQVLTMMYFEQDKKDEEWKPS
jgi:hypothetical protein